MRFDHAAILWMSFAVIFQSRKPAVVHGKLYVHFIMRKLHLLLYLNSVGAIIVLAVELVAMLLNSLWNGKKLIFRTLFISLLQNAAYLFLKKLIPARRNANKHSNVLVNASAFTKSIKNLRNGMRFYSKTILTGQSVNI